MIYLKGIHLALRALGHARAQGIEACLTIVGEGPARGDFERLTHELGLTPYVTFRGQLQRESLLASYRDHDVMLFPSLRDAGGMVILEAWSRGLPVICFDLGGPGQMVDETCGRVVRAEGRNEAECATDLGEQIITLATDEPLRLSLGFGAIARYRQFSWPEIVRGLYGEIVARLQREPTGNATKTLSAASSATIHPHGTANSGSTP